MTKNLPATGQPQLPIPSEKKSSGVSRPSVLASNVTKDNYLSKANDFLKMNGGGFLIALKAGKNQGVEYDETPRQFAAWWGYYQKREIGVKFLRRQMRDGKCYTVPAEWPHLFDSDATVQVDYQAGEYFLSTRKPEHEYNTEGAIRRAVVAAKLGYDPSLRSRRGAPPPPEQVPQQSQEYIDSLLASHAAGMADLAKRKADKNAAKS